jgi:hypothetical protein
MGNMAATRRNLQAILDGIADVTAKIGMFYPEEDEGTSECFSLVGLGEPILVIMPAMYEGVHDFLKTTEFSVKLKLFFAYANFQDFDYTELEDIYEALVHEICDMSNWNGANVSAPFDFVPFEKKQEHNASPRVILAEAKVMFKGST